MTRHFSSPIRPALWGFVATLSFAPALRAAEPAVAEAPATTDAPAPTEVAVTPARALFKEARDLTAKGDYQSACPKFEKSLALEPGLGTEFNLADCWEHIGRTASAQALFIGAAASAKAAGQVEREQVLRERAAALEPRIPRLVIEVEDPDPKLVVKRGELPLDSDVYGKAKAVDPGSYEIVAKSPGKKPWQKTIEVPVGASIVTVAVPPLEALGPEASAPPPEPKKAELRPARAPVGDSPATDHRAKGPSLSVLGLGALGVGGIAVGAIMAVRYSSANSDAKKICPGSTDCTTAQISAHDQKVDDARSARTWTYVGFGVGALGLGAAAALLFLPQNRTESAWVASPVLGNGSLGANLSGKF
ncbi:MAG TPA: tetratricopeptide repeat protein [Polyangiaceae bacterium]